MKKNIVLFGGSNSVATYGIRRGLQTHSNLINLALGKTTSVQNLYELIRDRNQDYIKNADLIVTESNLNEIYHHAGYIDLPLHLIALHIQWFYEKLSTYNKPVCIVILPYWDKDFEKINNIHRYFGNLYGFHIVDMHDYYEKNDLREFGEKLDKAHQLKAIMNKLGKNIAKNIDSFKKPKENISSCKLPDLKILFARDMQAHGDFKVFNPKNSLFKEEVYRLENKNYLTIPKEYNGYKIIAIHSWNLEESGSLNSKDWDYGILHRGSITIGNENNQVRKAAGTYNQMYAINSELIIEDDFVIKQTKEYIKASEISIIDRLIFEEHFYSSYFDLVSLFVCSNYNTKDFLDLDIIPMDEVIKIHPELDFTHLVPDVEFFKDCLDFMEEYFEFLKPKIKEYIQSELFQK